MKDTGIGIKKENHGKILKLFGFLQDSMHMNRNGIGLGLVIADLITQQFDSRITFVSKEGMGSTFTFRFSLEA